MKFIENHIQDLGGVLFISSLVKMLNVLLTSCLTLYQYQGVHNERNKAAPLLLHVDVVQVIKVRVRSG